MLKIMYELLQFEKQRKLQKLYWLMQLNEIIIWSKQSALYCRRKAWGNMKTFEKCMECYVPYYRLSIKQHCNMQQWCM